MLTLGWGQKVKYHEILITKSISKISLQNFVCVLTNKRYKTYQPEFSFCGLGHAPGVGLGVLRVKTWVWGFALAPHRLCV